MITSVFFSSGGIVIRVSNGINGNPPLGEAKSSLPPHTRPNPHSRAVSLSRIRSNIQQPLIISSWGSSYMLSAAVIRHSRDPKSRGFRNSPNCDAFISFNPKTLSHAPEPYPSHFLNHRLSKESSRTEGFVRLGRAW